MTEREIVMALIANDRLEKADAIVILEGDGFNRIEYACSLLLKDWAKILVFSGGISNIENGSYSFEQCLPKIVATGVSLHAVIHEKSSTNTWEQAVAVIDLCKEKNWSKIIIVASHYHQYRAFLTFLQVLQIASLDRLIKIINAPVTDVDWFISEPWGKRIDLLQLEFQKIEIYMQKGHVSKYENAIDYFKWKELP